MGMGADELDPGDAGAVLHFHHQPVFVAADVEHHAVVAADAGVGVLVLDILRSRPSRLDRAPLGHWPGTAATSSPLHARGLGVKARRLSLLICPSIKNA
jgi:hypothetical protein